MSGRPYQARFRASAEDRQHWPNLGAGESEAARGHGIEDDCIDLINAEAGNSIVPVPVISSEPRQAQAGDDHPASFRLPARTQHSAQERSQQQP